ncbi:MAG: PilZ domain-containing protein [Acidaminococcales bacterium]|jgi:c-di-GMP-binding flagellar brake protein YcgR|nr:PilZ domain-containing protein [Acidaminococcales bacterium]
MKRVLGMIVIDTPEKLLKEPCAEQDANERPATDTAGNSQANIEKKPAIIISTPAEQASANADKVAEKPAHVLLTPKDWFKPGQKIKARVESGNKDRIYETQVRGALPDRLCVDIPVYNNAFVVPGMGSSINASFIFNSNVYFFETVVLGITKLEGYPVWVLDMPSDFKRVQRRNSLRMDVLLPIGVRVETKNGIFLPTVRTNCLDISCGGVRYVLDFPLEPGKLVKIEANDFPGIGKFQAFCKAVRSVKSEYSEDNYWIGSQFVDLPHNTENKIARYIHQIQRRIVINSSSE